MKTSQLVWILIVVAVIGLWGYWYSVQSRQMTPVTESATSTVQVQETGIGDNLALGTDSNATLGTYLIGYTGMTVYTFSKDAEGTTTCYATCASTWPPYTVTPNDRIGNLKAGVNGTTGTILRADGQTQMTYNRKPLYFFAGDKQSGDTTGQGIGGVWFVVKP